jgi:hypothetical protein
MKTIDDIREDTREYHKKNCEKRKLKRRELFIRRNQLKFEKIKQTNPNPPCRKCPKCNIDIYYVNNRNLRMAEQKKSLCNYCKGSICGRIIPHNKGKYTLTLEQRKINKRNIQLKRNFGITNEDYNRIFNEQQGKCKICNVHRNELEKNLYVDHDHQSKKIRGLLCQKCNAGLGMFQDNINILSNALKYLQSIR